MKVALFVPCYVDAFFAEAGVATLELLERFGCDGWFNHEGDILRFVFFHSLALVALVGLFVTLQAYVYPFRTR